MGTPLGPKYIPYTYMDPLGAVVLAHRLILEFGVRNHNLHSWASVAAKS